MSEDEEKEENQRRDIEQREALKREALDTEIVQKKSRAQELSKKLGLLIEKIMQKFKGTKAWDEYGAETADHLGTEKKKADDYRDGGGEGSLPEINIPEIGLGRGEHIETAKTEKRERRSSPQNEKTPEHHQAPERKTGDMGPDMKPEEGGRVRFMAKKLRRFEAYKRLMRIRSMQERREAERNRTVRMRAVRIKDIRAQALRQINPADSKVLALLKNKVAKPVGKTADNPVISKPALKKAAAGRNQKLSGRGGAGINAAAGNSGGR